MSSIETGHQGREALERFALGPTISDRSRALTDLLAQRVLPRAAKSPEIRKGIEGLIESFQNAENDDAQLTSLAQLVRVAQSARAISRDIEKLAKPLLERQLPAVSIVKEADERAYVAKACSWSKAEWVLPYAIRATAEEPPSADKVRGEFVSIVFSRAGSLTEIFTRLADTLSSQKPETEAPGNSMAKRLAKILGSLRDAIVGSLVPPGEKAGESLADLVRRPFAASGRPSDEGTCLALARVVILCVHDLVRTRFSVSTDPSTYSAIRVVKRLVDSQSWPTELRQDLELVANSVLEAILLLAKQGIAARQLVEQLEIVVGYRERAAALLREVAEEHPEVPESVRAWLKGTSVATVQGESTALAESRDLRIDPSVGQALLDGRRTEEARRAVVSSVLPALQLYDPTQSLALETFLSRSETLISAVEEIAVQRRIGLLGNPGEEIDFAAKYFESVGGLAGQRVRVVRPAVVRLSDDGTPGEAVVKGLVE